MKRRRTNAKGRNAGSVERTVIVRRALLHSPQFSALSCVSRSLFFELHAMFNGTNNGTLFLSCKDATDRLGLSDLKAARAAFNELRDLGFITETIGSSFSMKAGSVSKARAWNLNWITRGYCVGPDAIVPLDFSRLSKVQKRRVQKRSVTLSKYLTHYQQGIFAVEDSATLDARKDFAAQTIVEESATTESEKAEDPPIRSVEESTHYIEYHRGAGTDWSPANPYLQTDLDQFHPPASVAA